MNFSLEAVVTEMTKDNIENNDNTPNSVVSELTKERNNLKHQLNEFLEKYNKMEDELRAVKTTSKEQEETLKKLQKRNKLLEDRNIANQEATQRLIRLECDKGELEEKLEQKDKKLNDISKKYENIREKAVSYDYLEEKVLYLEKERKNSQTQCKKAEEQLKKLQEVHEALKSKESLNERSSIAEEDDVFDNKNGSRRAQSEFDGRTKRSSNSFEIEKENNMNYVSELEDKVEHLSKELKTAQGEIQRLNTTVDSQLEDLEEMERIEEHKRKLETRCRGLEEQLVELEHEGTQRENEIDEMEEDIDKLQVCTAVLLE